MKGVCSSASARNRKSVGLAGFKTSCHGLPRLGKRYREAIKTGCPGTREQSQVYQMLGLFKERIQKDGKVMES